MATGRVFPSGPDTTVHTVPLNPGFAKVSVDGVNDKFINLALPMATMDASTLGEAKGGLVQWPEAWIELTGKVFL